MKNMILPYWDEGDCICIPVRRVQIFSFLVLVPASVDYDTIAKFDSFGEMMACVGMWSKILGTEIEVACH